MPANSEARGLGVAAGEAGVGVAGADVGVAVGGEAGVRVGVDAGGVGVSVADTGVGTKTSLRMGHVPLSGPEGTVAAFANSRIGRKIFIHINNTNPILAPGSDAERHVQAAGWDIAYDGMEIEL